MNDIELSIQRAKEPKSMVCGKCNQELYSPMDKLSISLYDKCAVHLEDGGSEEKNLLNLIQFL